MRLAPSLLAVAVFAMFACRPAPPTSVRMDPALSTMVPSDTLMLAGIRVDQLRKTAFWEQFVAGRELPWLETFVKRTGLDPRRDLWEFLLVSNGKDMLIMARGKFSYMGLEPKLEIEGARRTAYKGYNIIGDDNVAVTFLNTSTALAGRPNVLRSMIDNRGRHAGPQKALADLIKTIPANNQVWAAGIGGFDRVPVPQEGNLVNLGKLAALIQNGTAAADLSKGVHAVGHAQCLSEKEARTVESALKGFVGIARLSTPTNQPEMLRFYDGIQVSRQESSVRFNAEIPMELFVQVTGRLRGLPRP